jgi:hypothetical protein
MSASDLAPFVAAVLRDDIVANMKEEIDKLNSKLESCKDERLLVQISITGGGGGGIRDDSNSEPDHYHNYASLKDGYYSGQNKQYWKVKMIIPNKKKKNTYSFPLNFITKLEIRLGGTVVQRFDTNTLHGICNVFDTDIDTALLINKLEPQMCGIGFEPKTKYGDGPVACIEGRIGPMIYDNYIDLDILDIDELKILHETGKAQYFIITEIEFHISMISGCISLLTELGIIST